MNRGLEILRLANKPEVVHESALPIDAAGSRRHATDLKEQTREETIKLVRRVFFSGMTIPQVVVFSAVEHGGGCTWVCARAAKILSAHVDGLICLVDANLRSPSLHCHFENERPSVVSHDESLPAPLSKIGRVVNGSNLWLLSNSLGRGDSEMPQTLERLQSRLADLRNNFTYILIDSPPINAYGDATLLGRMADGLVMVLEANNTRREAAMRARETLNTAGVRLLGAVLNKRTYPIPDKLYRKL